MLTDAGPLGVRGEERFSPVITESEYSAESSDPWHDGFLFSPALTIGGGTSEVQRNIVAERVLGLPHDISVEKGKSWAEARATTG